MRWLGLTLAGLAAVTAIAACGDDDDAEGDVERYCEILDELEVRGNEIFEGLESDPDASDEDFEAAERDFVESSEDEFEELVETAPEDLREDVRTVLDGIRQRGGLEVDNEVSEEEEAAADEQVRAFAEAECGE